MIIADTSAVVALLNADDARHADVLRLYEDGAASWVLPWAILPEVDHLLATRAPASVQAAFMRDITDGAWSIEWAEDGDLKRARELQERHEALRLGLVDATVMATAERLRARGVATLDLRHFGAVKLRGAPKLYPRDS